MDKSSQSTTTLTQRPQNAHKKPQDPNTKTNKKVVSPFQAILDYELANSIAPGYINHTISRTAPNGAWQRVERGEIALDDGFFAAWGAELNDQQAWDWYHETKKLAWREKPVIRAKELFFNMMRNSRRPDPTMWPAVHRLKESGRFTVAALSNNVIYPEGCRDEKGELFEQGLNFDAGDVYSKGLSGEALQKKRDVRKLFDVFVGSAEAGLRKPDPEAYKYTIREVEKWMQSNGKLAHGEQLRTEDIVFIDDIGQNLRSARQLDMRTVKVTLGKNRDAVVELERITGVRLLDDSAKL